jgi:hypothetical protein
MTEVFWELYPVGKPGGILVIDGREITITAGKDDALAKLADKLLEVNAKLVTCQQIADVGSNRAYQVSIEHEGRTRDYRYHVRGQHRPSSIELIDAIDIVHDYFSDLYHEREYSRARGLPILNWIGFNVLEADEVDGIYEVKCEVKEDYVSFVKCNYAFKISKDGTILGVNKVDGYSL